jgi:hypothetical protein
LFIYRQQLPDYTTLFQFLNSELSLPCLPYNVGLIRAFNAIPSDVKLDVYVDKILLARELKYKQFSYSIATSTLTTHNIRVFDSSKPDSPIIETQIQIPQGHVATINIIGTIQNPQIFMLTTSSNQPTYSDRALIRYANLYDSDITVNVVKSKNVISTTMVKAKEVSKYSVIAPGTYQFQFSLTDSIGNNFLSSNIYEIKSTRIYTFYLVGSPTNDPNYPLEIIRTVDIMTVIKQCPPMMNRFL